MILHRREASWGAADQIALDARLAGDPKFAEAFRQTQESWEAVGRHATSPELLALREQAIARARQASARRWSLPGARSRNFGKWAAAAAILIACGTLWQLSPYGYESGFYKTGLGEQKVIELSDHSHITLDARTRLRVRFSADARIVQLLEGQAQFSVAKDPARPFKVQAGSKTIVAVGTVFDVEYVDSQVHVAMVEGKVAVLSQDQSESAGGSKASIPSSIELSAGEALAVRSDGASTVSPKADIEAATAWRQGKVIFRDQSLAEAVHRLNRYSRQQVIVDDPTLAQMKVTGVFDAGDAQAFAEAMQAYLPVVADSSQSPIHLRMK
ncbi:MAG TPA: FecR domain-containing protein [Steroidobacteraceae bacterium]|nr:FecR domain-containing protein [Steroidobacteraceae bacterium]